MDAVEEIRAAIDKLTAMQGEYVEINGWLTEIQESSTYPSYSEPVPLTSDPMIVTLHRTIDAQLAILGTARLRLRTVFRDWDKPYPDTITNALILARAINGGA